MTECNGLLSSEVPSAGKCNFLFTVYSIIDSKKQTFVCFLPFVVLHEEVINSSQLTPVCFYWAHFWPPTSVRSKWTTQTIITRDTSFVAFSFIISTPGGSWNDSVTSGREEADEGSEDQGERKQPQSQWRKGGWSHTFSSFWTWGLIFPHVKSARLLIVLTLATHRWSYVNYYKNSRNSQVEISHFSFKSNELKIYYCGFIWISLELGNETARKSKPEC